MSSDSLVPPTTVGRITFGPAPVHPDQKRWHDIINMQGVSVNTLPVHPCNCIGPQPGQTKCPCALRAERQQGAQMVRDGVVIDGRRYRLVPEEPGK